MTSPQNGHEVFFKVRRILQFFFFFEGDVMEEDNEVVLNMYKERSSKLERQNRKKNDFQIIR